MKEILRMAVVFALALLVGASSQASASKRKSTAPGTTGSTVSGYITDSVCGVKAVSAGYTDCTTKCLTKGAQIVIVVDRTHTMLTIENPDVVKGHECHHVLVTGDVNTQTSVIHIYSLRII